MKIPTKRRGQLEKFFWFVHHEGSFMQRAIAEQMERLGKTLEEKSIKYRGKQIPGFFLGQVFSIPEWLVDNQSSSERFQAYHANFSDGPWELWKKEMRTSTERIQGLPIARKLRPKDGIVQKRATTVKQRYRKK